MSFSSPMEERLQSLVWRGIQDANPWWATGRVPPERTARFRRHAFGRIHRALLDVDRGRGLVVLGPRRVGKTVLLHQLVEKLLADGLSPDVICLLSLDDVALRGAELGELLSLVEDRKPLSPGHVRYLLLDEIQHSPQWSGWLKRLTDRRDPYRFLATGSAAHALRHGGTDAGLGRWRELTLFPWSFREHVDLVGTQSWWFEWFDRYFALEDRGSPDLDQGAIRITAELGPIPKDELPRLDEALLDYLVRGGFPEVATAADPNEARRRLRQDILDRALGRDVTDVAGVDARTLEKIFLRICQDPGGLWNESKVSSELGVARSTVNRYLEILEASFLVFRVPNMASIVRGQSKVYLVAPSMRQALLGLDKEAIRRPGEWGPLAENAALACLWGAWPEAFQKGFWRRDKDECDAVVTQHPQAIYLEVKRSGQRAAGGIHKAAASLKARGSGYILTQQTPPQTEYYPDSPWMTQITTMPAALWLFLQRGEEGGTLRLGGRGR